MKLAENYKNIIDKVMSQEISGWESLSYLDPTKMIVAGLIGSLSQIEDRQKRLAEQMLSLTPSLVGLEAKGAKGPTRLFQLSARQGCVDVLNFEKPIYIRLQTKDFEFGIRFNQDISLLPLEILGTNVQVETPEEFSIQINLKALARLPYLDIYYVSNQDQLSSHLKFLGASLQSDSGSLGYSELKVLDATNSLSGSGRIRIETLENHGIDKGDLRLKLVYSGNLKHQKSPTFYVNAFVGEVVEQKDWEPLGTLRGESWEEVSLGNTLIDIPSEILLNYPSGGQHKIYRIKEEALRKVLHDPESLKDIFLYNASRHSIIIPAAHLLTGNIMGGLALQAKETFHLPQAELLRAQFKEETVQIEGEVLQLQALELIDGAQERESGDEHSQRLYSFLRQQHIGAKKLDLLAIRSLLLSADKSIREVELGLNTQSRELEVYVSLKTSSPLPDFEYRAGALPPELMTKLKALLSEQIPLDINWKLSAFQKVSLDLKLRVKPHIESQLDPAKVTLHLKELFQQSEIRSEKLFEKVKELSSPGEVLSLSLLEQSSGKYYDTLQRSPGTTYEVNCYVCS